MKRFNLAILLLWFFATPLLASDYKIDNKGMHASVQFKISHLGYSWLWGRFNDFKGTFSYDKDSPESTKIEVSINTKSVDTNHGGRDKHLRGKDFLNVSEFPEAKFVSTSFVPNANGTGTLSGEVTLHGVTKPLTIDVKYIGEGKDPWGGYRIGFEGTGKLILADFGITKDIGPASKELDLIFSIEGVRQ